MVGIVMPYNGYAQAASADDPHSLAMCEIWSLMDGAAVLMDSSFVSNVRNKTRDLTLITLITKRCVILICIAIIQNTSNDLVRSGKKKSG